MDPRSILFTLPTICDEIPETLQDTGHDAPAPEAIHLHGDDWRQIEFIVGVETPQVDREIAAIQEFKDANRTSVGWKNVYIRKERPDGLFPAHLPSNLVDTIPHGQIQPLTIETLTGQQATVKGGFAVRLGPTLVMYGRQYRGIIVNLALTTTPDQQDSAQYRHLLALCKKFNLIIVDWCAGRVVTRP